MRQRGPIIAGLAIASVAALVIAIGAGLIGRPPSGPAASGSPTAEAVAVSGPVVYYEIVDADGAKLMARTLDGRSLARVVAVRTDVRQGRTWTVDPTGTMAIAATTLAIGGTRLDGVSVATGATTWTIDVPATGIEGSVWSSDGRRYATTTQPDDPSKREALVLDATRGALERTGIPADAVLQGFESDGALVLRLHRPSPDGTNRGWRFFRIDPATQQVDQLARLPDVGPATDWNEDVDPAAGIGFDQSTAPGDDTKTVLRMWSVAAGTNQAVATLPTIDRVVIDPGGASVAVSVAKSILVVGRDGRTAEAWTGPNPPSTFDWSTNGGYLAVTADQPRPSLSIVERGSGRTIQLPLPMAIADAAFVRVVDGAPLPAVALPAVEPTPTPTAAPSGPDVASSDGVLVGWIETINGEGVLHVDRRTPTSEGGMRTVSTMAAADLGRAVLPDDPRPEIALLPRPHSGDVLVWVELPHETRTWLWAADGSRHELALPAGWPTSVYTPAWRPDGLAIAGSAVLPSSDGTLRDAFVIAPLGGGKTTVLRIPPGQQYNRLEGWWSPTELKLAHTVCTEGCPGQYAWSARFGVETHHLIPLTPADRARGPIDQVTPFQPSGLDMLPGNDMANSTIHIDWPAALGATGPAFVQFAADGRSLIVATEPDVGTDLYRIDDPAGRATAGHLADPQPVRLGHLSWRGIDIRVSPDERWALTTDRTGGVALTELATGRSWSIDRLATTAWPTAG